MTELFRAICIPPARAVLFSWMRKHYGPERTMAEFLASEDAVVEAPAAAAVPRLPAPAPA
jgi:hypothetical protein